MHILLLGKHGQVGWELQRTLATLGEVTALDYPQIDLATPATYTPLLEELRPQAIINAAAFTAVDRAESEPDLAMAVNGQAPGILAEFARKINSLLVHFSTNFVFDGAQSRPYLETDTPNPINAYGRSKLAGEQAVRQAGGKYLILRTSWVYSLRGDSFVNKVLNWSREQKTLRIVSDQTGSPTWARLLAEVTALLLYTTRHSDPDWLKERTGLYHLAGDGYTSRLRWAEAILRLDPRREEQVTTRLIPAKSSDFPTPANRPPFSALNCDLFHETFNLRLPDWEAGLHMALDEQ
jgi:dTDP-4-dehydrorhamnose reductase